MIVKLGEFVGRGRLRRMRKRSVGSWWVKFSEGEEGEIVFIENIEGGRVCPCEGDQYST